MCGLFIVVKNYNYLAHLCASSVYQKYLLLSLFWMFSELPSHFDSIRQVPYCDKAVVCCSVKLHQRGEYGS